VTNPGFMPFDPARIGLAAGTPGVFCVEASAGTGKTYSISGLVLRLVAEEGLPIDRVLVVTYTRAAASELRERIAMVLAAAEVALDELAALEDRRVSDVRAAGFVASWLEAHSDDDGRVPGASVTRWLSRVRAARARVDAATIATIHSFCQRMLEWHAFESGQPLGVSFVEDEAALQEQVINDLWVDLNAALSARHIRWAQLTWSEFSAAVQAALNARDARIAPFPSDAGGLPCSDIVWSVLPSAEELERSADSETWRSFLRHVDTLCTSGLQVLSAVPAEEVASLRAWIKVFAEQADSKGPLKDTGFSKSSTDSVGDWRAGIFASAPALPDGQAVVDLCGNALVSTLVDVAGLQIAPGQDGGEGWLQLVLSGQRKKPDFIAWSEDRWGQVFREVYERGMAAEYVATMVIVAGCHVARARFERALQQRAEATFDDLVLRLASALRDESDGPASERSLLNAIRGRYGAALIDEFQDTDTNQWTIFEHVFLRSAEHRLFLIGDPKQAIYRFRGADIDAYLAARTRVAETAVARGGHGLYTMQTNYRSDGALMVAFNRLFGGLYADVTSGDVPPWNALRVHPGATQAGFFDVPSEHPSGIDYIYVNWAQAGTQDDVLGNGAHAAPARLSVNDTSWSEQPLVVRHVLAAEEKGGDDAHRLVVANKESSLAAALHATAHDIQRLLSSSARVPAGDDGGVRHVTPGDIAVLVGRWRDAATLRRALARRRIPAVVARSQPVLTADDALDVEVLLGAIVEPRAAAAVTTALATPLLSVPATALRAMRVDEAGTGLNAWRARFAVWRAAWERHGLLVMVRDIMELRVGDDGMVASAGDDAPTRREALLKHRDGERRLANLTHLFEILHVETTDDQVSPVAQLDAFRLLCREAGSGVLEKNDTKQQRLESDDASVRILTIHGSKGLEFPFVFLPTLGFDGASSRSKVDKMGPIVGPTRVDETTSPLAELRTLYPTLLTRRAYVDKLKRLVTKEEVRESRRNLYVALTRAMYQVVLYAPDWSVSGKVSTVESCAGSKAHQVTEGKVGAAFIASPWFADRLRDTSWVEAGYARACEGTVERDGSASIDVPMLFGEAMAQVGALLNPRGTSLVASMRAAPDVASSRPYPAPWVSRDAAPAGPLTPPDLERGAFYDPTYRVASFSMLARGASHSASSHVSVSGESDDPMEARVEERGGRDEVVAADADVDLPVSDYAGSDESGAVGSGAPTLEPPQVDDGAEDASRAAPLFERTGLVGRDFGTAMHAALERVDFGGEAVDRERPVRETLAHVLASHGFQVNERQLNASTDDLIGVLDAPLGGPLGGFALRDIHAGARVDELEFWLPVDETLSRVGLREAFAAGGEPGIETSWSTAPGAWSRWLNEVDQLTFSDLHGFLRGYIDLVFVEVTSGARRFHILDYKTNKLHRGNSDPLRAYAQPLLVEAMVHSRYVLQYHIYLVALHRYLRTRLGAAYNYDDHVGGAWYPYLRGLDTTSASRDGTHGLRRGMFYDRPPRARIEALDTLFAGHPSAPREPQARPAGEVTQ